MFRYQSYQFNASNQVLDHNNFEQSVKEFNIYQMGRFKRKDGFWKVEAINVFWDTRLQK